MIGTNFRDWFESFLQVIRDKGKTGYLNGTLTQPAVGAANYELRLQKIQL